MTESVPANRFFYLYSCDLECNVQIKIGSLEGKLERPSHRDFISDPMLKFSGVYRDDCADLYVTCQVCDEGKPMASPVRTAYKPFSTRWNWNEWLTLPVRYSDLPRNAQLAVTVWDIYGTDGAIPIGGTTITLFGKYGTFRQGMVDLKVWPQVKADGSYPSSTPGKSSSRPGQRNSHRPGRDQMTLLSKLTKRHHDGQIMKVDWLDRLTFREIEHINEREKRDSNFMYLMVEFPQVYCQDLKFTVVYYEKDGDNTYETRTPPEMVYVPDPEILQENLVESKHHKLVRSLRSGPADRDLKPNAVTRDQLNSIVLYPPTKMLSSEEEDLVWKFRFYLSNQKKALTKFLKSVNWSVAQETKQALELLHKWSPMDVEDALELLGPTFTHPAVRKYAVTRLKQAPDEDLLLYLLQLVQALRYENFDEIRLGLDTSMTQQLDSPVMDAPLNPDSSEPDGERRLSADEGSQKSDTDMADEIAQSVMMQQSTITDDKMDLATFLISRACKNASLANYFYWYLHVESDDMERKDNKESQMYVHVLRRFSQSLVKGGKEYRHLRSQIVYQQTFMERLVSLVKNVARESGNRKKKIERLQALLSDEDVSRFNFSSFEPLMLPLDPDVKIKAIIPNKATLFKSALMPCRLTFRTVEDADYVAIFKHGDDLRQDQLILQIITLMDKLLRRENLDLKLTPYKVLATSSKHGFVQFIDSLPIAEVLATEGSILNYFRKLAPSDSGPYGIQHDVMDNYIKSCAGYCVVTYVLGVGDRHLDNLLLTKTGKLFHIDFGYILGRDPKPLPPPMKLSKEMVEGMGGEASEHFHEFKKLSYTAFLHLRRHSNLFLNLFSLMVDASVPDIALEPDKTVKKVQDKFRLDLTDEEAVHYMQNLIDVSVSAMMAALVEQMHKIAQYWRK